MFDYAKLKGRIREVCETDKKFAEKMGIDRATLSKSLNNRRDFSQEEIQKACAILQITTDQIGAYFFKEQVAKKQLSPSQ